MLSNWWFGSPGFWYRDGVKVLHLEAIRWKKKSSLFKCTLYQCIMGFHCVGHLSKNMLAPCSAATIYTDELSWICIFVSSEYYNIPYLQKSLLITSYPFIGSSLNYWWKIVKPLVCSNISVGLHRLNDEIACLLWYIFINNWAIYFKEFAYLNRNTSTENYSWQLARHRKKLFR